MPPWATIIVPSQPKSIGIGQVARANGRDGDNGRRTRISSEVAVVALSLCAVAASCAGRASANPPARRPGVTASSGAQTSDSDSIWTECQQRQLSRSRAYVLASTVRALVDGALKPEIATPPAGPLCRPVTRVNASFTRARVIGSGALSSTAHISAASRNEHGSVQIPIKVASAMTSTRAYCPCRGACRRNLSGIQQDRCTPRARSQPVAVGAVSRSPSHRRGAPSLRGVRPCLAFTPPPFASR
jgi:hypothetical protein